MRKEECVYEKKTRVLFFFCEVMSCLCLRMYMYMYMYVLCIMQTTKTSGEVGRGGRRNVCIVEMCTATLSYPLSLDKMDTEWVNRMTRYNNVLRYPRRRFSEAAAVVVVAAIVAIDPHWGHSFAHDALCTCPARCSCTHAPSVHQQRDATQCTSTVYSDSSSCLLAYLLACFDIVTYIILAYLYTYIHTYTPPWAPTRTPTLRHAKRTSVYTACTYIRTYVHTCIQDMT